jgi:mRNA-degrading endonuclease RelE of RelBE toxin-antitoxin system
MPSYILDMSEDASKDLSYYRAFERKLITDEVVIQLVDQPDIETHNRKRLGDNPIAQWELKVGKFRVFYEIDVDGQLVTVVSVGHKEHNALYIRGKAVQI